jgi:hypothetical protein
LQRRRRDHFDERDDVDQAVLEIPLGLLVLGVGVGFRIRDGDRAGVVIISCFALDWSRVPSLLVGFVEVEVDQWLPGNNNIVSVSAPTTPHKHTHTHTSNTWSSVIAGFGADSAAGFFFSSMAAPS